MCSHIFIFDYFKIVIKSLQYILTFSGKASAVLSDNGLAIVHIMLSGHGSFFFTTYMCAHGHAHMAVNESVHFSMFHWPQQYCKPLHIHSSRTPNRKTDKDCVVPQHHTHHTQPPKRAPSPSWPPDPQNIHQMESAVKALRGYCQCICSELIVLKDFATIIKKF